MHNFRIVIQYEGTRYQGWQRQESTENTIQGKLEAILSKMCGTRIEIQGAGRTDGGVHALGQVANFKIPDGFSFSEEQGGQTEDGSKGEILSYLNRYLPEDIAVIAIQEMPERFHSRLQALGKTYRYRIINSDIPHIFERRYAWEMGQHLDLEAMREAAVLLCGTHDFSAFTSHKKSKKSNIRTIHGIQLDQRGDEILFQVQGSGFLYHMVRILVGTLVEVGLGKRKPEEMEAVLHSHQREKAGMLVPAKGLTLVEVHYR